MIGDCGLTLQTINGNVLPEIGYHIRRDFQRRGYAKEAAKAVLNWVFRNTDYPDEANGITLVSVISKEDWLSEIGAEVVNQQKEGLQDGI